MSSNAASEAFQSAQRQVLDALRWLPQAPYIPDGRRAWWAKNVLSAANFDPALGGDHPQNRGALEQAQWHVRRMRGLGGSEVGTLVAARRGEHSPFATPRDVVANKFCLRLPEETDHTVRGHNAEAVIQESFYRKFGAAPDDGAKAAFEKGIKGPLPGAPWRIGNPDDIVTLNGRRLIVDYKCPENFADFTGHFQASGLPAPFGYICQLHHYRGIASHKSIGVPIDGLAIVAWNARRFEPVMFPVPFDPELEDELVDVGHYYWSEFVLEGRLPAPATPRFAPVDTPIAEEMAKDAEIIAIARSVDRWAKGVEDEARRRLESAVGRMGALGDAVVPLLPLNPADGKTALMKLSARMEADEEGLSEALRRHGLDEGQFRDKGAVDHGKLVERVLDLQERARAAVMAGSPAAIETALQALSSLEVPHTPGSLNIQAASQALTDAGGDPSIYLREAYKIRSATGSGEAGLAVRKLHGSVADTIQRAFSAAGGINGLSNGRPAGLRPDTAAAAALAQAAPEKEEGADPACDFAAPASYP